MALEEAIQLVQRLAQLQRRIVLAESCTGGLISAELAKVPGVSDWFCGSAVTYRSDTKIRWLGVAAADIVQHSAVSQQVASQMAEGVLRNTPEASLSASITGHLGPDAPADLDGVVYVGLASRIGDEITTTDVLRYRLDASERTQRQSEAARQVLKMVMGELA